MANPCALLRFDETITQMQAVLGYAPDRAIRGRIAAIVIDGLLSAFLIGFVINAAGIDTAGVALLTVVVVHFLYFFLQEGFTGKTIGKRVARMRVVQLDGTEPTLQQYAIRNALRIFDAIPMFYASGLVAIMWSGPALRQRMGDRVATTTVIMEPNARSHNTPGWLLPVLTVSAVLLSVITYGAAYNKYHVPDLGENALLPTTVPGFAGDNSQGPVEGTFTATALLHGQPVIESGGKPMTRTWRFSKACSSASACTWTIVRQVPAIGEEKGELHPAADGWHVNFPTHAFKTRCHEGDSDLANALRRATFVIHFEPGGRALEANERTLWHSKTCGEFIDGFEWRASVATF
jgi:uncharacterized RDD family membrane protein YckC